MSLHYVLVSCQTRKMATDVWYSGYYSIEWVGGPPAQLEFAAALPGIEPDFYDIRITDGGVLWLRSKSGDGGIHAFAPYKWMHVRFGDKTKFV